MSSESDLDSDDDSSSEESDWLRIPFQFLDLMKKCMHR
jgi:hypothetical protein